MVLFAAATGLRPGEWIALEHRDIDLDNRLVYVRRAFRVNRLKATKTDTPRAVPVQRSALRALDLLPSPPSATSLLFPAPEGGYLDLHNWRPRHWRPAQRAALVPQQRRRRAIGRRRCDLEPRLHAAPKPTRLQVHEAPPRV